MRGTLQHSRRLIGDLFDSASVSEGQIMGALRYAIAQCPIEAHSQLINEPYSDRTNATLFYQAVQCHYKAMVAWLMRQKTFNPIYRDEEGNTPLHHLCTTHAMSEFIVSIFEMGAIQQPNQNQEYPLELACRAKLANVLPILVTNYPAYYTDMALLKKLLAINSTSLHAKLFYACIKSGLALTKRFLQWVPFTPTFSCAVADSGDAIEVAIHSGQLDVLKLLVNKMQFSLSSAVDINGNSAVMLAIKARQFTVLKWLVDTKKQNLRIENVNHEDALMCAAMSGSLDIVKWLIQKKQSSLCARLSSNNPIEGAIKGGHLEVLKWLWQHERSCYLACYQFSLREMAQLAMQFGQLDILKYVYQESDDTQRLDAMTLSDAVFHQSVEKGYVDIVAWLLQKGRPFLIPNKTWVGFVVKIAMLKFVYQQMKINSYSVEPHLAIWLDEAISMNRLDIAKWIIGECQFDISAVKLGYDIRADYNETFRYVYQHYLFQSRNNQDQVSRCIRYFEKLTDDDVFNIYNKLLTKFDQWSPELFTLIFSDYKRRNVDEANCNFALRYMLHGDYDKAEACYSKMTRVTKGHSVLRREAQAQQAWRILNGKSTAKAMEDELNKPEYEGYKRAILAYAMVWQLPDPFLKKCCYLLLAGFSSEVFSDDQFDMSMAEKWVWDLDAIRLFRQHFSDNSALCERAYQELEKNYASLKTGSE